MPRRTSALAGFDRFLENQRARFRLRCNRAVERTVKAKHEAVALAEEVVTVKGSYGGAPSAKIQPDRGIEWQVRNSIENA